MNNKRAQTAGWFMQRNGDHWCPEHVPDWVEGWRERELSRRGGPAVAHPYHFGSSHWPGVAKVVEELGELSQVLGKIMGTGGSPEHWDGSGDLVRRLEEEMGDVLAAVQWLGDHNNPVDMVRVMKRAKAKYETFDGWHHEGAPMG
jgi:NTP pyrophosphatase (non-canonical NTP hydrolase)